MYGDEPSQPARYTAELFKKEGKTKILELGSGQGRDTIFFAKTGFQITVLVLSMYFLILSLALFLRYDRSLFTVPNPTCRTRAISGFRQQTSASFLQCMYASQPLSIKILLWKRSLRDL